MRLTSHWRLLRLLNRGPLRHWMARRVWAELEHDPAFVQGMERARADLAAGRRVLWSERQPTRPASSGKLRNPQWGVAPSLFIPGTVSVGPRRTSAGPAAPSAPTATPTSQASRHTPQQGRDFARPSGRRGEGVW